MRALLLCCSALASLAATVVPADAALLKNVKPGVICKSADALAKLTLPDGSSRSGGAAAAPAYKAVATTGGCVDVYGGGAPIVILKEVHKNTSVILYQNYEAGETALQPYYVANIDFVPYSLPHSSFNDEMRKNCSDKLEPFIVDDTSGTLDLLDSFISTLPASIQKRIAQQTEGKCEAGWRCQYGAESDAVSSLHLDKQWADYLCKRPD